MIIVIIVRYCGGLGNQMFQYAVQLALTKKYKNQEIKGENFYYFLENEHNAFELETYFNIDINLATKKELKLVYNGIIPKPFYKKFLLIKYPYKCLSLMNLSFKKKCLITDDKFNNYVKKLDNLSIGNWYLRGFWQKTEYFENYRKDILSVFPLKCTISEEEKKIVKKLENGQYIAVHVRGGDFIGPKYNSKFNLCGINYYQQALKEINKENLPLVVFTDDIKYSKELLNKFNVAYYISHDVNNSIADMYMLSMSKKLIISNSTFAFWGAYLSKIVDQEVICPKYATWDGTNYRFFTQRNFWKVVDNRK